MLQTPPRSRPGDVAQMLRAQRKAGTVKDPHAIQGLEVMHGFTMKKSANP